MFRAVAASTNQTGAIRDVVQNHLFQVLSNLTMEPPARLDSESIRDEKVKVLKSIPALGEKDVVRGQFRGYRDERGVTRDSADQTFAALRLEIDSWRWKGVPFYIRAGKCLPVTCTEILVRLRTPPAKVLPGSVVHNHVRLRISPDVTIAMSMIALAPGEGFAGRVVEMLASRAPRADDMDAYERLLGAALEGDATSFAREDYVEEAWRIVEPILDTSRPPFEYEPNTWGPPDAGRVIPPGGWHNPTVGHANDGAASDAA